MKPRDIVLIVDDSPDTLSMLTDALEGAGYTALVALSGTAVLALIERVTPDVVLMDAIMPGMDGFEACQRLKRNPAMASVPVIFMTGLAETEHVLRALDVGGVDYVTKPVHPDQVVARIRVHIANARLTRSAQVALDAAGRFLLAVDRAGRVRWCTPQAARLLEQVQGDADLRLPEPMCAWIERCVLHRATKGATGTPMSTTVPSDTPDRAALEITFVGQIGVDELLLRLTRADPSQEAVQLRDRLGLTAREAEVLMWIGHGKANRDIASILGLSPRTVNKHLEQVFTKLGVENRATAATIAVRTLQGG